MNMSSTSPWGMLVSSLLGSGSQIVLTNVMEALLDKNDSSEKFFYRYSMQVHGKIICFIGGPRSGKTTLLTIIDTILRSNGNTDYIIIDAADTRPVDFNAYVNKTVFYATNKYDYDSFESFADRVLLFTMKEKPIYSKLFESLVNLTYEEIKEDMRSKSSKMTMKEAEAKIWPGLYLHYKGNEYEVLGLVTNSETLEPMVLYQAQYGLKNVYVRPAYMWNEEVKTDDGTIVPRFRRIK